jgi:hypothetical protein
VSDVLVSNEDTLETSDVLDSDEVSLRGFDATNHIRAHTSLFELFLLKEEFICLIWKYEKL